MKYRVTAILPIPKHDELLGLVLDVAVDASIEWVRKNVDAIVANGIANSKPARSIGTAPCALMVEAVAA